MLLVALAPAPAPAPLVPPRGRRPAAAQNTRPVIVAVEPALSSRPPGAVSVEPSTVAETGLLMLFSATAAATEIVAPPLELIPSPNATPPASALIRPSV